jgi:hypothetical protein
MRGIVSLKGTVHPASLQNSQRNHCLITRAASRPSFESSRIARLLDLLLRLAIEHPGTRQEKFQIAETQSGAPVSSLQESGQLRFGSRGHFISRAWCKRARWHPMVLDTIFNSRAVLIFLVSAQNPFK